MASDIEYVNFVIDNIKVDGEISYKPMFGEYGIYCILNSSNETLPKIFAVICDNKLFFKPTTNGKAFIEKSGKLCEAPPYPGASDRYLIEEKLDDSEWLSELTMLTVNELPAAKPRKPRKSKKKSK